MKENLLGDTERRHESYALISVSRCQGSGHRLFGSEFKHSHTIRMEISTAIEYRSLSSSHYHDDKRLVEIYMTEGQFAQMISTLNVGNGTPCTLNYFNGKMMGDPPETETEQELGRKEFADRFKRMEGDIRELAGEMEQIISDGKSVGKLKAKALVELATRMADQFRSNTMFAHEQFEEATNKVIVTAKTEVEAFLNEALRKTGLNSLSEQAGKVIDLTGLDVTKKIEQP